MTNCLKLFFVSLVFLVAACAPDRALLKAPEQPDMDRLLADLQKIGSIHAEMAVVFEKNDSEVHGEAVLDIEKGGDMAMNVSALGIPALELTSKKGLVKSSPRLDKNRTLVLTRGLRDGIFWWDMADGAVRQEKEQIIIQSPSRQVVLDRSSLLPVMQTILFDDGRQLTITYEKPAVAQGIWYQSKMKIAFLRYVVTLTTGALTFGGLP